MANNKDSKNTKIFPLEHWQIISVLLILYDFLAVNLSYFVALWLRFDLKYTTIPTVYLEAWLYFAPIYTIFCLIIFGYFRLYKSMWRFASYTELVRVIYACLITAIFHALGSLSSLSACPFPTTLSVHCSSFQQS